MLPECCALQIDAGVISVGLAMSVSFSASELRECHGLSESVLPCPRRPCFATAADFLNHLTIAPR